MDLETIIMKGNTQLLEIASEYDTLELDFSEFIEKMIDFSNYISKGIYAQFLLNESIYENRFKKIRVLLHLKIHIAQFGGKIVAEIYHKTV